MNEINREVIIKNSEIIEKHKNYKSNISKEIRDNNINIISFQNNCINNNQNKINSCSLIDKKDDSKKNENNSNQDIINNTKEVNSELSSEKEINLESGIFPYCIVWTPIPIITYIIPSIGHSGIGDSNGIIHDFAGSFFVSVNNFAFGKPTKYFKLELTKQEKSNYDKAIEKADNKFNKEEHNLLRNNCHHHVAYILNELNYHGENNYNMVNIWCMLITKGKFVSFCGFFKTYIGCFIIILIIVLIVLIIVLVKKFR